MKYSISVYWNDEIEPHCYTAFAPDFPDIWVYAFSYHEVVLGIVSIVSEIERKEKVLSMYKDLICA